MTVALNTQFTYPQVVIQSAVQFPAGHYVELDDIAFEANGLGRKVVQAQSVSAHGKEFSVGYLNVEGTGYVPIQDSARPVDLGDLDSITRENPELFRAVHQAFGGAADSYSHLEMVVALRSAIHQNIAPLNSAELKRVAAEARLYAKRAVWVHLNAIDAITDAPINWATKNL